MSVSVEESGQVAQERVDVEPLFRYGGIVVTRWRCRVREAGGTALLRDQWHFVKFVHTGAFLAQLAAATVHVDATRTLLTAPHQPFLVTRQYGPDVCGSAIGISPRVMREIIGDDGSAATRLLREDATPRALLTLHLILRKIKEGAPPAAIEDLGVALATDAFAEPASVPQSRRKRVTSQTGAVSMAQAILAANYEKPVRLEAIAEAVDSSPHHLCRSFKSETGVHMRQYLNRLRLRAALEHVADPDVPLATIAHNHGFSSHSHFAAAFRKEFRLTPSEARGLALLESGELRSALGFELSCTLR